MIIITVAKKPSKKSITDCALENSCGALNIKASRIGNIGGRTHGGGYQDKFVGGKCLNAVEPDFSPKGRWPGNLFLAHNGGCIHNGFKQVASNGNFPSQQNTKSLYMASKGKTLTPNISHHKDRKETVEDWDCVEKCPVQAMDDQSGITNGFADTGGASRFFKVF